MISFLSLVAMYQGHSQINPVLSKDKSDKEDLNYQVIDSSRLGTKSTTNKKIKDQKATIDLYKIISFENDTTLVDTTLSIKKEYRYNYLRKDNFGLLPFNNIGQTYNSLTIDFRNASTLPLFGARAKHFNYMEIEDINYYHVPTPFTELLYKTAFEQGQLLDAFFSNNISKQFNFSIAYKGLRSLGKYQRILSSTGNFRATANYVSKNNRYQARGHMVTQDLMNYESGGLSDEGVSNFESGEEEFIDRGVFDPILVNAQNILKGKRFHLEHQYDIVSKKDSTGHNILGIGNILSFEDKYYQFDHKNRSDYFGDAFRESNLSDRATLEYFRNRFYLVYSNNLLGNLSFNADYGNYNYGYDTVTFINGQIITNRIKGDVFTLGGAYQKKIGQFDVKGQFGINISGDFEGNFLNAGASYQFTDDLLLKANINTSLKAPNYNWLLYQSDYMDYNWDNTGQYRNISTQQLALELQSQKLATIAFDYNTITNYAYFSQDSLGNVKPFQDNATINYIRIKANKEFKVGNFALDNTVLYQKVLNGQNTINVPQLVTRNTLYYSNHLFKKALYLQTGVIFNYFTSYNMNAYDPLLAEFYVQNDTKIGDFPRLDFFVNAKVRQTRIFFKLEHFNSSLTGYDFYSAPHYPYRDFIIRFGLVWNFFL